MILIVALLLLTIVAIGLAVSDLRLINKLRQQRASASAMPSLQTLLDRAPAGHLANENAALSRRLHQLEEKLELLESQPRTSLQPPEIRPTATNGFPAANRPTGGDEESPEAFFHVSPRVMITAEEILFLTGEFPDLLSAPTTPAISTTEGNSKRFKGYFPANGDLIQHANVPRELADFVRSAVVRGLRLEGFAIHSKQAADEFLAKLTAGDRLPFPSPAGDIRSLLARELMTYIAAHPQRKVRGRGEAPPLSRAVTRPTPSGNGTRPPDLSARPQDGSSAQSVPPLAAPDPSAQSALPSKAPRKKRHSVQPRKKKGKTK